MCDPITAILGVVSAGSMLLGNKNKQMPYTPPPVENPAVAAPTSREPGAIVRVGDGTQSTPTETAPEYNGFTEKRVFGKSLGGLGRGGLDL